MPWPKPLFDETIETEFGILDVIHIPPEDQDTEDEGERDEQQQSP